MFKKLLVLGMILAMIPFVVACKDSNVPVDNNDTNKDQSETSKTPENSGDNKKPSSSEGQKEESGNQTNAEDKDSGSTTENPFHKDDKDTPVSNKKPQVEGSTEGSTVTDKNTTPDNSGEEEMEPITEVPDEITKCTYQEYHAMTADTQKAFFEEFENIEAFFDWYNDAKAKYEKENAAIEIEDGEIDLGDVMNGKK